MNYGPPGPQLIPIAQGYAETAHEGQERKYNEGPYIQHPRRVAAKACFLGLPWEAICAAWLHDTVEDCDVSPTVIDGIFGRIVRDLVLLLSDLQPKKSGSRKERKARFLTQVVEARRPDLPEGHLEVFTGNYLRALHTLKILDITDNARSTIGHAPKFWHSAAKGEAEQALLRLEMAHGWAQRQLREILTGK